MKITMINGGLPVPAVLGGAISTTLYDTAMTLNSQEFSVISPWDEALRDATPWNNEIFYHVDIQKEMSAVKHAISPNELPGYEAKLFSYLNGVSDHLENLNPDVVQIHNGPEFFPFLKTQFPEKKFVLYFHNQFDYSRTSLEEYIGQANAFVFVSNYLLERFCDRFPDARKKSLVILNGIDTDHWRPDLGVSRSLRELERLNDTKVLLFVGRTQPMKGIHNLLEAFDHVRKEVSNAVLLVIGSPIFGAKLTDEFHEEMVTRAKSMDGQVRFVGYVGNDETPKYYTMADLTVVPSVFNDPCPKVVIESLSCGTPVVATRRGGIPELIDHGETGMLLKDPNDIHALADCLVRMLLDDQDRNRMSKEARKVAERSLSRDVRFGRLNELYETIGTT